MADAAQKIEPLNNTLKVPERFRPVFRNYYLSEWERLPEHWRGEIHRVIDEAEAEITSLRQYVQGECK
ncbi:MAG: hypothetical protein IT539_13795 [Bradyrhizobiaceae bacterium]|nr:hypothetical protein [Bradyrhizobiaceae bacterium]